MRFKISLTLAASALLAAVAINPAGAQDGQDDQKLVDDFVSTRGVSIVDPSEAKKSSSRRQTAQSSGGSRKSTGASKGTGRKNTQSSTEVASSKSKKKPTPATNTTNHNTHEAGTLATGPSADANVSGGTASAGPDGASSNNLSGGGSAPPAKFVKASTQAIGLGYTLFVKQGESLHAAGAGREFKAGDKIRVALETNTDGYLYIFYTENGLNPQMLFPNNRIDGGANVVAAHARDFVPADMNTWFEFDNVPATERLYIVISRNPLAGVPTGEALLDHCGGARREHCYWKPTPEQWKAITAGAPGGGRVRESQNTQLASLQVPIQSSAMTRGIKVKKEEPAPAIVRVNDSAAADVLVTTIDLVHK